MMEGLSGPVSEKQNQLLSMVSGTNKTLLLMINNVLDSYKLDAGGETFNGALIDLGAVINECVRDAESLASEKEIQIHQVITCRHSVYADSLAMRRVIANLLSNAIKFTGRGGTIEARFEELQGSAVMSIKDTGIGISSEHLPHLFERFYQADSMNRAVGLGLGLHLCKQLVEGQNGTITCVSEPKRGTTFAVRLPLAFEEKAQALIIDDNAANQLTLQRILKFLAVESIAVSSGQEALKAVAAHPFQAIFMDISMPDMDGYRVSKAMREAGQTMPIIAFTGLQNIDPKKMAEVGINDVIYKPVDIATVRQAVKQWMPGCELR
jgi:CheY-like chemotaxis protein/anti-sigma regulatory factor (Ser/Thr protein kinase)